MIKNSTSFNPQKAVAIIPAYEPPYAFVSYVKELLSGNLLAVVVVNDGSNEKYAHIFSELEQVPNCHIVQYETNHGKGYALRTAFEYCKNNFSADTVFVTADCDGQHLVHDVLNVLASAADHPGKLVLGSRDFSSPNVPMRSRSGNLQARRIFSFLYKISISDTQTGLRAFSYSLLDDLLAIKGDRFEYEMSMLIVFKKKNIDIIEVPIETVYNDKSEDVEKVSHYRTIRDSMRVLSTLLRNLEWYLFSSVVSAILDVASFYLLLQFVFTFSRPALNTLMATAAARVISSIANFIINFKLVFNGKSKKSMLKYYLLWTIQLGASYGYATALLYLTGSEALTTTFKAILDLLVGLISYQVQARWVFVESEHNKLHFYGPLFRFVRFFFNIFKRPFRSFVYPKDKVPSVYVCRHLNLQGPTKVCQSLGFDVHSMVLHNFFTVKKCRKQYSEYTFTERSGKRGIKRFFGKVGAFFASLGVPPFIRSMKAIPVYRGGADSLVTLRRAAEYLAKGENIAVYPDVDYAAESEEVKSDIYQGFLYIDKLYHKKTGKHIDFVVIKVNTERRDITEVGRVSFSDDVPFREDMDNVAKEIQAMLMA